jgi:hypothetical protein
VVAVELVELGKLHLEIMVDMVVLDLEVLSLAFQFTTQAAVAELPITRQKLPEMVVSVEAAVAELTLEQ